MKTIEVKKLRTASVYAIVVKGMLCGLIPLFCLFGILASFGLLDLQWNAEVVTGAKALVVGPIMGVFFALFGSAVFGTAMALGLWIYSLFRPLRIEYVEIDGGGAAPAQSAG